MNFNLAKIVSAVGLLVLFRAQLDGLCDAAEPHLAVVSIKAVDWPGEAKRNQIAFCHDGVITVFGGTRSDDPRDFTPPAYASGGYRIDIDSGAVTPVAAGPAPLMSVPSVVIEVDGRPTGLALGGIGHDGTRMDLSDRVWAYDFASDAWSDTGLRLPSPRTLFGVTTYAGAVWCFGGWEMDRTRAPPGGAPPVVTQHVGGMGAAARAGGRGGNRKRP
ncbi:MAG: kelch repeat-containing protein, partial [Planctomycetota bacterium]